MQRQGSGAQRRYGESLSKQGFGAQLPRALADLERGSPGELQSLLDARLGSLCRAGLDEVLAAGDEGLTHVCEALAQVVQAGSSLGARTESLEHVRDWLETLQKVQVSPAAPQGEEEEQVPRDLAPKALLAGLQRMRREGGDCFKRGERQAAAATLERALRLLGPYKHRWLGASAQKGGGPLEQLRLAHAAVLMNLSLCYLQGQPPAYSPQPAKALRCCQEVLELDPGNSKALLRKGKALLMLGLPAQAEQELARASQLDPADAGICKELALARQAAQGQVRRQDRVPAAEGFGWSAGALGSFGEPPHAKTEVPLQRSSADLDPCLAAPVVRWPMLATARETSSFDEVQTWVEKVMAVLAGGGQADEFAEAVVDVVAEKVCSQLGQAARGRLARVGSLVRRAAAGAPQGAAGSGPGPPLVSAYLEGLSPEQPFHDADDHSWCATVAASAASVREELREEEAAASPWEEPAPWGMPHPDNSWLQDLPSWQTVALIEKGVWVAEGFPKLLALLGGLQGLRPAAASLVRLAPGAEVRLHWDSSNFVLGAHFGLESEEGCSLGVGADPPRPLSAGRAVVAGHAWEHAARNGASEERHVLSCFFYHPGVDEAERYALQVLELLSEGLESEGVVGLRHPSACGG